MTHGAIRRLLLLAAPIALITAWFLHDGGMSFGWNFIYYWLWIIAFLTLYELALISNTFYRRARHKPNQDNRIFLGVGAVLLLLSMLYFFANLN